ncbi:MAG: hypothetical protein ACREGR_01365, partial [Minisyncoccia bacterium]
YESLWKQGPEAVGVADVPEGLSPYPHFTRLVNTFSEVERDVLQSLDWGALADAYGLGNDSVDMLGYLASRAHGRSLAAYSMTEIMPYGKERAADNIPFYNFLLRTAGPGFIEITPAMFDELISFGPFQFTKFAIEDCIADPHSPFAVNQFLPESKRVPSTIKDFATAKGPEAMREHAAAALLFGLENVAVATRELMNRASGPEALEAVANMDGGTFASLLAMHHYRPTEARRALIEWAEAVGKGVTDKAYHAYAESEVAHYGERSHANFDAVERYFEALPKA